MSILEILGYVASVVIALSMLMSSIMKLRWINLAGAFLFSLYGFLIGALPVGLLNGFIVCIDVYYLIMMYSKKELFKVLEIRPENKYLIEFLEFHKSEINKFFPEFSYKPEMNTLCFLILRDMAVAGVFLAHEYNKKTLKVGLDYVIPEYRDFKPGKYIYLKNHEYFLNKGYEQLCSKSHDKIHDNYLRKMGFSERIENGENLFFKDLKKRD
jgi:hypothetical protein